MYALIIMQKHIIEILTTLLIISIIGGILVMITNIQKYCLSSPNGQVVMISAVIIIIAALLKLLFTEKS